MKDAENTEVRRALCFGYWLKAGVLATVEVGKVVKLGGGPGHPVNQGWICERSKTFVLMRLVDYDLLKRCFSLMRCDFSTPDCQ